MQKSVLLINDMAGYGKVALSAMIPLLSHMQCEIFNLPTALVSNTLDYGKFDILETTDYMRNSLRVWDELGFSFDAVSTGFLVSAEQTSLVAAYCHKAKAKGALIFVDPIMGDDGHLYNGVGEETVKYMRSMCSVADVIVPNLTEATFLAAKYQSKATLTREEAKDLLFTLRDIGSANVIVTSAKVEGENATLILEKDSTEVKYLPYTEIPVRFPGTGDIFSSVLIGNYLKGMPIAEATQKAMDTVVKLISLNIDNKDKYKGIPLEQYLEDL